MTITDFTEWVRVSRARLSIFHGRESLIAEMDERVKILQGLYNGGYDLDMLLSATADVAALAYMIGEGEWS